jgi:hypothetical protein
MIMASFSLPGELVHSVPKRHQIRVARCATGPPLRSYLS